MAKARERGLSNQRAYNNKPGTGETTSPNNEASSSSSSSVMRLQISYTSSEEADVESFFDVEGNEEPEASFAKD